MDIKDLINNALEQKPVEFTSTFNDLIVDKLQTAVATRKANIAQSMFGDKVEEPEEETSDTETQEEPETDA